MSESEASYLAPPIIDAIIEFRFQNALSEADRERVSKKFRSRYPLAEEGAEQTVSVSFQPTGVAAHANVGERFTRRRTTESPAVIQIGNSTFAVATGAPYVGWQKFFDRFVEDWAIAKKVWKYRPITRIGMRYVNRIDLEPNAHDVVEYEDYLNLRINLPESFPPTAGYDLGFQSGLENIKCGVTVRSGTAAPAVPGKMAFTLDIDVWRIVEVPQKDTDVLSLLCEMRRAKNDLFETFITDKARALFNAH